MSKILNKLIDYIFPLVVAVILLLIGMFCGEKSLLFAILLAYPVIGMLILPLHDVKYIQWIVKLYFLPLVIVYPVVHNLRIIAITITGILFSYVCAYVVFKSCEVLELCETNTTSLTIYLSMTFAFILATQNWYGKIIDRTTNRYHSKYKGFEYQPAFAKYIIYTIYFFVLLVSYILKFANVDSILNNTTLLLASFATFVAYDRLISNKRLLEKSKILTTSDIKDKIMSK